MSNDLGKLPPFNEEAEQSFLGSILIDPEAMIRVADQIRDEDFYFDRHRLIFSAMLDLYTRHEPIDLLSLGNRLDERKQLNTIGGRSYLAELTNIVPTSRNVVHYAAIIQKKATLRRMIQASSKIAQLGYASSDEDVEVLLDQAEKEMFSVSRQYLKESFTPIRAVLTEAFERIDALHKDRGKLRGIPTGFAGIDNLLAGLQRSDLVVLAARPSVGKTSLALAIARHAAVNAKIPTGLFSLEMSKEQLVDRLICAEANVDLWKLRTGKLSDRDDDFPRIGHALGVLSEAPIYIDDSASANIMSIRTKCRRLQSEHGLGLVVIDYLQLMESRGNKENRVQEVAEISRGLKQIARELEIPILALSQLSRVVEMSKPAIPKLSHLRESGCLTGDTRVVRADTGERIAIRDLVGQTNVPIFSLDATYRLRRTTASRVFSSGRKRVYELTTRSGRIIKASANHKFYTLHGWQRLDALQPTHRIALPRHIEIAAKQQEEPLSRHELILLAHLLGDGCVLPRQPIHYTSADPENLAVVEEAARVLFAIAPRRVQQQNWWHSYLPSPYRLARGTHHPIMNWFAMLGIQPVRSYQKRVPSAVFMCSDDAIRLFLNHLWATDGNISWKRLQGRLPSAAIYYATTSQRLATDVQHLLLRLGIWSTVRTVPQGSHRPCYQVHIQSAPVQRAFLEQIGCHGARGRIVPQLLTALREIATNANTDTLPQDVWRHVIQPEKETMGMSWRGLAQSLHVSYGGSAMMATGISRTKLATIAHALSSETLLHLSESDIYWDEIISVTPRGIEDVYDMTVPETQNFVAEDFIVHNSIEQDADVVMFIYRKAADKNYRTEELSPEEKNIAEVHISKHRNGPTGVVKLYFDAARADFKNLERKMAAPPPGAAAPITL